MLCGLISLTYYKHFTYKTARNEEGCLFHLQTCFQLYLTVTLLEASAGRASSELLRLAPAWISDKEGPVIRHENLLDLLLGGLVDVLLVVRHDGLGDGLADGVNLGSVASTLDANTDVEIGELLLAEKKDRLEGFEAEDLGLEKL